MLLGLAEFGDGFSERGQLDDEHKRRHRPVLSDVGERRQQPGGLPQSVPHWGRWRDTTVRGAGGAVVGVSGLPQDAAAQQGGGHMQGIGGGQAASAASAGSVQAR
jgi:hypothetical protein